MGACGSLGEGPGADKSPGFIFFPKQIPDGGTRPTHPPENISRVSTDTGCRNGFFLGTLLAIGLVALSFFKLGEFGRLDHYYDYEGKLCGIDAGYEALPYVFYCGSKELRASKDGYPEHLYHRAKTCVAACPKDDKATVGCLRPETFQFHEAKGTGLGVTNGINYELTYEIEVHQTVEQGKTYATNTVGSFCIPKDETLKLDLINGPLSQPKIKWLRTMRSIVSGGLVVIGACILALILGFLYLKMLSGAAGLVMFGSLVVGTLVVSFIGIFLIIAIFFNPEDYNNGYCKLNPIIHTNQSSAGTFYSFMAGLLMLSFGGCLFVSTKNAMPKIDESVGMISAALQCVNSHWEMGAAPICFFLTVVIELFLMAAGLSIISTVGYIDHTSVQINDESIAGLEAKFVWYWGWEYCVCFYCFMCWWIFETTIAHYQFTIAYAVVQWYWVKPKPGDPTQTEKKLNATPKFISATVAGVDSMGGQRKGVRIKSAGGNEIAVFPVGKRGPGTRDVLAGMNLDNVIVTGDPPEIKYMPSGAVCAGSNKALFCHLGTLARGAPIVAFCRGLRLLAMAIRATCGRADKRTSYDDEDATTTGALRQLTQLLAGLIENICGGLSKNAFVDCVLSAMNWEQSTIQSKWMVEDAGGVVAFMHGSCVLYEIIGVTLITSVCSIATNICLKALPFCTDPDSMWYVEDSWSVTVFTGFLTSVIAYSFMAQFNITIDAMLYTFAWARRMKIARNKDVLPSAIRGILDKELEADPDMAAGSVLQPLGNRMNPFGGAHFGHAVSKLTSTAFGTRAPDQEPFLGTTEPNRSMA